VAPAFWLVGVRLAPLPRAAVGMSSCVAFRARCRRAKAEPFLFARTGLVFGGGGEVPTRRQVITRYLAYAVQAQKDNYDDKLPETMARSLLIPLIGLFHGTCIGARWRQEVTDVMHDRQRLLSARIDELVHGCLGRFAEADAVLDERPEGAPRSDTDAPLEATAHAHPEATGEADCECPAANRDHE